MGFTGSPLAIAHELEKKGYDPVVWKEYLNNSGINVTDEQRDQIKKPQPTFHGFLNDLWFDSISGVE